MIINESVINELQFASKEKREEFFIKNIGFIKAMAFNFVRKRMRYSDFDDCVQQVFVDMYNYDYTSIKAFFNCVYRSFYKTQAKISTLSLNATISQTEDFTFEDIIADTRETEEEEREHSKKVIEILDKLSNLTLYDKDNLLSFSFGCGMYKGIFEYAKTQIL